MTRKRSALVGGWHWRVMVWRALPQYDPEWLDDMPLPVVGALLGNDVVEPSDAELAEAETLRLDRAKRATQWRQRMMGEPGNGRHT